MVVSTLGASWSWILAGLVLVFLFQLFREPIMARVTGVRAAVPSLVLPSQEEQPWLYRGLALLVLLSLLIAPFLVSRSIVDLRNNFV